jgi:hypothetical protein
MEFDGVLMTLRQSSDPSNLSNPDLRSHDCSGVDDKIPPSSIYPSLVHNSPTNTAADAFPLNEDNLINDIDDIDDKKIVPVSSDNVHRANTLKLTPNVQEQGNKFMKSRFPIFMKFTLCKELEAEFLFHGTSSTRSCWCNAFAFNCMVVRRDDVSYRDRHKRGSLYYIYI